jgi:hypothetical protein
MRCTFGAHALQMDRPKPKFKANTRLKYGAKERKCSLVSKTSQSIYNNCSFKASSRLFGGHFSPLRSHFRFDVNRLSRRGIPKTDSTPISLNLSPLHGKLQRAIWIQLACARTCCIGWKNNSQRDVCAFVLTWRSLRLIRVEEQSDALQLIAWIIAHMCACADNGRYKVDRHLHCWERTVLGQLGTKRGNEKKICLTVISAKSVNEESKQRSDFILLSSQVRANFLQKV